MLEGVLEVWEEPDLVKELGSLQPGEPVGERVVRKFGDGLEEGKRHVLADGCGGLKEALVLRDESIDASGEEGLHGGRDQDAGYVLGQEMGATGADQHTGLDEGADALLEEERVALGPLGQQTLEWLEARVTAEQAGQEVGGALRRQRVDTKLPVVRLTGPAVLVLGAIADQEEQAGARQALGEPIEQGLGLRADTVHTNIDTPSRHDAPLAGPGEDDPVLARHAQRRVIAAG